MERITTLERLMEARARGQDIICPTIRDFSTPHHARDITALPLDVLFPLFKAGLFILPGKKDEHATA
jgi:hypothetical protein